MHDSTHDDVSRVELPTPPRGNGERQRRVLMISYHFPPAGGGGVQRVCKMARYLPQYGWIPHVLTVEHQREAIARDDQLLRQLPDDVHIHRAPESALRQLFGRARAATKGEESAGQQSESPPSRRLARAVLGRLRDHLLVPDEQIIWRGNAVRQAVRLVQEHCIDAIFSTHGPATNHLVALATAEKTDLPWVADFRDPWVENLHFDVLPAHRQWRERRLERRTVQRANAVTTVTRAFAHDFCQRYSERSCPKIHLIYNGFDPADYRSDAKDPVDERRLTCVYAGALYPKRSPETILRATRELIDRGHIDPQRLRLVFAGIFDYPGRDENARLVERLRLEDVVEPVGHLPHAEAISLMRSAHALLVVGDSHPRAGDYIPGKIYEYMALARPVIGTLQRGEARQLLQEYVPSYLTSPGNVGDMAELLRTLYEDWIEDKGAFATRKEEGSIPRRFHRDYQAGQLASVLNRLTGQ